MSAVINLRTRLESVYGDDPAIQALAATLRDGATPAEVAVVVEAVARTLIAREREAE